MFNRDSNHKNYRFSGSSELHRIIQDITEWTGLSRKDVGFVCYMFLEEIVNHAVEEGECKLFGFGRFVVQDHNFTDFDGNLRSVKVMKFYPGENMRLYVKGSDAE